MCLDTQRKSEANPKTERIGYVVIRLNSAPREDIPVTYKSIYSSRDDEVYIQDKWYKAKYLPLRRRLYFKMGYDTKEKVLVSKIDKSIPGFHAFNTIEDASYFREVKSDFIMQATFKGVVANGDCEGKRAFRAKHRRLDNVIPEGKIYKLVHGDN